MALSLAAGFADSAPNTPEPYEAYTLRKRPWRLNVTSFEDIIRHKYTGMGTEADPYRVDWISGDSENPQTWRATTKWGCVLIVAMASLAVTLSSSAYTGGFRSLAQEFDASSELLTAGVSLYVLGFGFGPLLWAPLSEVLGRRWPYIVCFLGLTFWQAVSPASPNIGSLLVFRFLAGFFAAGPLSNAGATVFDVMSADQRAVGMAVFSATPYMGPGLGPISGGYLGESAGWRWVEGFLAILCGFVSVIIILCCPETYAPALLRERAARLSRATGKVYRCSADHHGVVRILPVLRTSLTRPWKFLVLEPIVLVLSLYISVVYGVLYLNFAAYPIVFSELRGWGPGKEGLAFLGILVGTMLSVLITILYISPEWRRTVKRRGHSMPEDRLKPSIWGGVCIVVGLAGFAATDGPDVHWIAPIVFGLPFGVGLVVVFLAVLAYLTETYTVHAASVLAANAVLRSVFGAAFPLFTPYMYNALGVHWAAALPGCVAAALIPCAWLIYSHGASIRSRGRYAADATDGADAQGGHDAEGEAETGAPSRPAADTDVGAQAEARVRATAVFGPNTSVVEAAHFLGLRRTEPMLGDPTSLFLGPSVNERVSTA